MIRVPLACAILAVPLSALAFTALGEAQTLNVGVGTAATSIDPHYHNNGLNNALTMHIFDRLVERDGVARPRPGLAEQWRSVSNTE